jgi:hypothetical protein
VLPIADDAHKHLFMGSENRTALIMHFQPFAVASSDGFLGNLERRWGLRPPQ